MALNGKCFIAETMELTAFCQVSVSPSLLPGRKAANKERGLATGHTGLTRHGLLLCSPPASPQSLAASPWPGAPQIKSGHPSKKGK